MEKEIKRNLKWIIVAIVMVLVLLFIVFPMDNIQQKNFETAREAYTEMENGNYEAALESFYVYEEGHSALYWKLVDIANDGDEYCYDSIQKAIAYCEDQVKNKGQD